MATTKVTINGKTRTINPNTDQKVIDALNNLVDAMSVRRWPIGMYFDHVDKYGNEQEYHLVRIKQPNGSYRAYLINADTGIARNSRKVVKVLTDNDEFKHGYVEDLPAEYDRFVDPDGDGSTFLDV